MTDIATKATQIALGRQIRHGISWNVVNLIANKGISIIVRLLLARLLVPEDFGLIAMIIIFLGLINIFVDFGLKNALIQRKRDTDTLLLNDSAFWFLLGGGVFWTTVFLLAGIPLMAWLYDEPQLKTLATVMGLSIILHSLSIVPEARLTRRMDFKSLVIAEAIATLTASAITISMAFSGAGVWALVVQQLSLSIIRSTLIWRFARWHPRWQFTWQSLHSVMGFSGWMLGNQVVHYLRNNMDKALIGYLLGATSLGIYTLAFMLTETMRVQISNVIGQVMFPAYSRIQDDRTEIKRLYLNVIRYMTLTIFPIATLLILYAEPLILLLFGEEWIDATNPVQILALASMVFVLSGDPSAVLRGLGKPDLAFLISLWNTVIVGLPSLVIGTTYYGINGTAWAVVIHYLTSRVASQFFIRRELNITEASIIYSTFPALVVTAALILIDRYIPLIQTI